MVEYLAYYIRSNTLQKADVNAIGLYFLYRYGKIFNFRSLVVSLLRWFDEWWYVWFFLFFPNLWNPSLSFSAVNKISTFFCEFSINFLHCFAPYFAISIFEAVLVLFLRFLIWCLMILAVCFFFLLSSFLLLWNSFCILLFYVYYLLQLIINLSMKNCKKCKTVNLFLLISYLLLVLESEIFYIQII